MWCVSMSVSAGIVSGRSFDGEEKRRDDNDSHTAVARRYDTLAALTVRYDAAIGGNGLYATKAVKPNEQLLILPPSDLLNVKTAGLKRHGGMPSELLPTSDTPSHEAHWPANGEHQEDWQRSSECNLPLTSVQALTLLLAQWHAKRSHNAGGKDDALADDCESLDLLLHSYPRTFASLPLTWQLIAETEGCAWREQFTTILDHMPTHIGQLIGNTRQRFARDVAAIESVRRHRPDLIHLCAHFDLQDLAWAWASVNSRCLYSPLQLKPHEDNFTLGPLLDMANHTSAPERECKVQFLPTRALQLTAPPARHSPNGLSNDDEVLISYGPHSNGYLLAEYGFTLASTRFDDDYVSWYGNTFAEVNVDRWVEQLLDSQGQRGQRCVELLKQHNYWQNYTIHPYPSPAHPSYRLVLALRLITALQDDGDEEKVQQDWISVVQGRKFDLGPQNEKRVQEYLVELCDTMTQDAQTHLDALKLLAVAEAGQDQGATFGVNEEDVRMAARSITQLHKEEMHIAQMVKAAVLSGHTDW